MVNKLIGLAVLLGVLFLARDHIFGVGEVQKVTPKLYEKPIFPAQWLLPDDHVPSGFKRIDPPAGQRKIGTLERSEAQVDVPEGIPSEDLKAIYKLEYSSDVHPSVKVIVAHYKDVPTAEKVLDGVGTAPRFMRSDFYGVWFVSPDADVVKTFHEAYRKYLEAAKERRKNFEKVVVASNAYLKLFTNVLVGALLFILVLYFVKTMMITRKVEEF